MATVPPAAGLRVATFNASLNRFNAGDLVDDLSTGSNAQAAQVAEIIQKVRPDVLLINEFDFDDAGTAARLFRDNYLAVPQGDEAAIDYPHAFVAPTNTGVPTGFDLNGNGVVGAPGTAAGADDAQGFGFFEGQYGMLVLSRYPIVTDEVRTFRNFLWKDMPGARLPDDVATPEAGDFYSEEERAILRLSSKSHWDVPIEVDGEIVHFLTSHPTPPVFDGPEDRNGLRNADEIRFWSDYVTPGKGGYIYDDQGGYGGLGAGERFVIAGDQNSDPLDGDSLPGAAQQLLDNPLIDTSVTPTSDGGPEQSVLQGGANESHRSDPAFDTADFSEPPGNIRADYVLPSQAGLAINAAGVFWPQSIDPDYPLVTASDHRPVYLDLEVEERPADLSRKTVGDTIAFLGAVTLPTGTEFEGTEVGGLSGVTYDVANGVYYAISDDRSQIAPARVYTLTLDVADGSLGAGDLAITDVTTLLGPDGNPYPATSLDPEGIALSSRGTLFISSEGDQGQLIAPFVDEFSITGQQFRALDVPDKLQPTADQSSGIRNNLALESLTVTPDERYLFTATENALFQDGGPATLEDGSPSRILKYDVATGAVAAEYIYEVDAVADAPVPADGFVTNGLVELLAIDDAGTLLALERGFSTGVGNSVKLYEVRAAGATDVSGFDDVFDEDAGEPFDIDQPVSKELLLDFADLGLTIDNLEAITLGPKLADGRQSLIVVGDNNFSAEQTTQVIALALDLDTIPHVAPARETPPIIRYEAGAGAGEGPDPDDPAIYVHPSDAAQSFVITSLKNGGLKVFDLAGGELQTIAPEGIRYNNVDLVYGFELGGERVDLVIVSDRANDTIAAYAIAPASRTLSDVTGDVPASIFGVDDGEATAYGLASYTSPVTGKHYVFVTQASGAAIAQLELCEDPCGGVAARVVRTIDLPVPTGDPADSQSEGIVIDQEYGIGYVALEGEIGVLKFQAEPDRGNELTLVASMGEDYLQPDVEGLDIYYGPNGTGYLIASSQGDNTFAAFDRRGANEFLGQFFIGEANGGEPGHIDGVEETDGIDIVSSPLGSAFPTGLMVVQDGSNDSAVVLHDPEEGEIQNFNANFKYVPWENVARALVPETTVTPGGFDPRAPRAILPELANHVAAGDTTQTSTVLWARLDGQGDEFDRVTFELSTEPDFSTIVRSEAVTASDPLIPAKLLVEGLDPNTSYYYRAIGDGSGDGETGVFRTSAEAGDNDGLRFGVSGDWRGELSPYPAVSNAPARNLEFFMEHGDTIYADYPSPAVPKEQAETLTEYRLKHAEVYGERFGLDALGALRSSTSILAGIDDHEVTNDFAGGADPASDPRFATTGADYINETALYANGLEAFHEYNPIEERTYAGTGDDRFDGAPDLYRANSYGSDATTILLDARSFRDEELDDVADLGDPAQIGAFIAASFDPGRTMLGVPQLERMKADLLEAQEQGTTWKFVMVPEPIQNLGVLAAADRFEGYAAERTEILSFVKANGISNVVFIAADVHGTVVNNLTYQEAPFGPQIDSGAFEITTGAVAFDQPFGPSVLRLASAAGLVSPADYASYLALPVDGDADDVPDDKDDFFKALVNQNITPLGYDPLGLDDNLPGVPRIDAKLLQGDYVAAHTYGWTEFDVDPGTQALTVTTWGTAPYSEEELLADPSAIVARDPTIVSQFVVAPQQDSSRSLAGGPDGEELFGGTGDDALLGNGGDDRLFGVAGDDTIVGGAGADFNSGGAGFDTIDYSGSSAGVGVFLARVDEHGVGGGTFAEAPVGGYDAAGGASGDAGGDSYSFIESVVGSEFDDLVYGKGSGTVARLGGGGDVFDNYHPSNAQDKIYGESGDDVIYAGGGTDWVFGGPGDDRLFGENGADFIDGGPGDDVLAGGAGADTFVYGLAENDGGSDLITDFTMGEDVIDLFRGVPAADVTQTLVGDDLVVSYAGLYAFSATLVGVGTELAAASFI